MLECSNMFDSIHFEYKYNFLGRAYAVAVDASYSRICYCTTCVCVCTSGWRHHRLYLCAGHPQCGPASLAHVYACVYKYTYEINCLSISSCMRSGDVCVETSKRNERFASHRPKLYPKVSNNASKLASKHADTHTREQAAYLAYRAVLLVR